MDSIENGSILLGDINMELHGNPSLVDGIHGKVLSLNGIDQYAEISHHKYVHNIGIMSKKVQVHSNLLDNTPEVVCI